jgi:hypothetical protein
VIEVKPRPVPQDPPRSRRARLQALLFHGATIGAALLMVAAETKLPRYQGE